MRSQSPIKEGRVASTRSQSPSGMRGCPHQGARRPSRVRRTPSQRDSLLGGVRVQAVRGRLCMGVEDPVQSVKDQGGEESVYVGGRGGGEVAAWNWVS